MITDYVDHKFITSIDHAKKLLTDIENNKRKEIGEKLFKSNEEFDDKNLETAAVAALRCGGRDILGSAIRRRTLLSGTVSDVSL